MKAIMMSNMDILIEISKIELNQLVYSKETLKESLELIPASTSEFNRKVEIKYVDGESPRFGDGVDVKYDSDKETYNILIQKFFVDHLYKRLNFGSRYGLGEKIDITVVN